MEENEKPGQIAYSRGLTGRKKSNHENRRTEAGKPPTLMQLPERHCKYGQRWLWKLDGNFVEHGRRQPPLRQRWLKHTRQPGKTTGRAKMNDVIGIAASGRLREDRQRPGNNAVVMAHTTVSVGCLGRLMDAP
jgi:hypothetical protein